MFFAAAVMATSCQDMLTPDLTRFSDEFAKDSVYSAFGILKSIQNVGVRTVVLDEARSDLSTTGTYTTDSVLSIANFENPEDGSSKFLNVADYYHIINSCNFYLSKVDTVFLKNNENEMLRETAQIQALRAWTYLQLVRLYREVPFVTEPVSNSDEALSLETSAPKVNASNLIDSLISSGLDRAFELQTAYGLPNYGSVNNGSSSFDTRYMFIPVQLVMADAYLLKNDYAKAAEFYYDFFKNIAYASNNESYRVDFNKRTENDVVTYSLSSGGWLKLMDYNHTEQLAMIVGAANKTFGTTMTDLQNVFGFSTSATQSTSLAVGEEDASQASTSASVSISPNETYQQILPSLNYTSLNEAQTYCMYDFVENVASIEYNNEMYDGRLDATCPYVQLTRGEDKYRIIDKFCPASIGLNTKQFGGGRGMGSMSAGGFSIRYNIPLYRMAEVYLRFAEAINRLGFPELAFGILKDGLIRENYPTLDYKDFNNYYVRTYTDTADVEHIDSAIVLTKVIDDTTSINDTIYFSQLDTLGNTILIDTLGRDGRDYIDTTLFNKPYFESLPTAMSGGMYYLSLEELEKSQQYPFLDFYTSDRMSDLNLETNPKYWWGGIHSRGCGMTAGRNDTVYTYARMVAKKVAENRARLNSWTRVQQEQEEANLCTSRDSLSNTLTKEEIINAVEDLIVDENALECAFEGHRFSDLVRFAGHKTAGAEWLAWKVARRNTAVTADATEKDASLYQKLLNQDNWYFSLPKK